jgi:hypothetical protein
MKIEELEQEITKLRNEIDKDTIELENVPERFVSVVKGELKAKENRLIDLELKLDDLIENGITDRLQKPIDELQEIINSFILDFQFQYPQDKEMFINQITFEENDDELLIGLKPKEKSTNRLNKYSKDLLKVTIDNNIIQEAKTTDTFIKTLRHFSIEKVKSLNLVFLGVPLIAEYNHDKYQQKQISNNQFVLTQVSKEKKKEILEYIAKKFNHDIKIEFVKK